MQLIKLLFFTAISSVGVRAAYAGCSRPVEVAFSPLGVDMYLGENGTHRGVYAEFLNEITARTGCVFRYIDVPRARAWVMWREGKVDIVPDAFRNADRDRYGLFLDQFMSERISLISLAKNQLSVSRLVDIPISQITVGVGLGYDYGPHFRSFISDPRLGDRLTQRPDMQSLVSMLKAGRFDAVVAIASLFLDEAKKQGIADQIRVTPLKDGDVDDVGIYLAPDRVPPADAATLKAAITKLSLEDFYRTRYTLATQSWPDWARKSVPQRN